MAQLLDDVVLDASAGVHRPRNLDWKRAAALLYGDWGTSKAYVTGLAFLAAGFSSLPIILAVCAVTGNQKSACGPVIINFRSYGGWPEGCGRVHGTPVTLRY